MEQEDMNSIDKILRENGYIAEGLLGEGSFGKVYLVKDRRGEHYACKTAVKPGDRRLLLREAEIQKSLKHPLFPAYWTLIDTENHTFLIMEYVKGISLKKRIGERSGEEESVFIRQQALCITSALAEGLQYLHDRPDPVLYRDLKAEHVILSEDGQVRLIDLGCACPMSQAAATRAGTRGYAPPEQLNPDSQAVQGPYSDVYALGCLIHYMLTGADPCLPPYTKPGIRCYDKTYDLRLEYLIEQCMAADHRKRIQDIRTLKNRLDEISHTRGMRRLCGETAAYYTWIRFGKIWESDFVYEKNICRY